MICDDADGNHSALLSTGDGTFKREVVEFMTGWCGENVATGSYTQWADLNGDGKADMLCDDTNA